MGFAGVERRTLISSLAAGALAPGVALGRQATPAPGQNPDPLRYYDKAKRLTVRTMINGQGPFDFMVDTGANSSVIATELADQLGLARVGRSDMHGIAGVQSVDTVIVDSITVGRRGRRRMRLSVLPRATLKVDGILGLEWLGRASLLLDFKRRRMVVGEGLPVPDPSTFTVKARLQKSGLTLIDAFMPSRRILAFVDSGSTTTVGNLAFFEEAVARRSLVGPVTDTELRSVTGQELKGRRITMSSLTLGKVILRRVPMVIGPIHTFDFWGMHAEPAVLIGSDILQYFETVAMDFKAGEVRFRVAGPTWSGVD